MVLNLIVAHWWLLQQQWKVLQNALKIRGNFSKVYDLKKSWLAWLGLPISHLDFYSLPGNPPQCKAWAGQCLLYLCAVIVEKATITLLVQLHFWVDVRKFILLPVKNHPKMELFIVMLVIPFVFNVSTVFNFFLLCFFVSVILFWEHIFKRCKHKGLVSFENTYWEEREKVMVWKQDEILAGWQIHWVFHVAMLQDQWQSIVYVLPLDTIFPAVRKNTLFFCFIHPSVSRK